MSTFFRTMALKRERAGENLIKEDEPRWRDKIEMQMSQLDARLAVLEETIKGFSIDFAVEQERQQQHWALIQEHWGTVQQRLLRKGWWHQLFEWFSGV